MRSLPSVSCCALLTDFLYPHLCICIYISTLVLGTQPWALNIINFDWLASADETIRMWMRNKLLHTFTGHTGAVRGLAIMPEIGFASCANDG